MNIVALAIGLSVFAAWLTHIVDCFQLHTWGLLIAGAIFFPVGVIHGAGVWFGLWA
jgi:hypothetical protein